MSDQSDEADPKSPENPDDRRLDGERRQGGFGSKVFQAGDVLLCEGEIGDEAYLIRSGKVEIRKGGLSDNPTVVASVGVGNVIGEMSLIDDQPHTASAVSLEETHVTVIAKEEFKRRFDLIDPIIKGVLKILVERLRLVAGHSRKQEEVDWQNWKKT